MLGKEEETQLYLQGSTCHGLQMFPDGHCSACPPPHTKAGVTAKAAKEQQALVAMNFNIRRNISRTLQEHQRLGSPFIYNSINTK